MHSLSARWHADGGYREFLVIAFPLILSSASWSLQHFVDRIFLTWYSTEALAAGNPGGLTNFVILSLFLGLAQYVNTFVAQYVGARRYERVGPAVWQGVHLSVACGLLALIPAAYSVQLFDFIGHDPAIRQAESDYFSVLCFGIGFHVLATALSSFFSGRGQTWTIMLVTVIGSLLNVLLDYVLIFGNWGFPEWGIRGAGWATNAAGLFAAVAYFVLFLRREHRVKYNTLTGWRPDLKLLTRLFRYGGPSGLTFMLDILAFSIFILMAGRLGTVELAATNLATHINGLAFMPLMGAGIAVSTMVGQRLGRNQPEAAEYCTWTGFHLGLGYMTAMALAYVVVPELFLSPFRSNASDADFTAAYAIAIPLLRIVAVYCVFDAFYAIFTAALKGAGDTGFIMWASLGLGWSIMVIPVVVGQTYFGFDLFTIWGIVCFYICVAAVFFYLRFRGGKWKLMRVIEETDLTLSVLDSQGPGADEQIDQVRTQLGAPTNDKLFPPHFLKSTFPKIGGHTVLFLRDGQTVAVGLLFPRASSTDRHAYTLRLHCIDAGLAPQALEQAALRATEGEWSDADIHLYQPEEEHSFAGGTETPAAGLCMVRPDAGDASAIRRMQQEIWSSEADFLYPVDLHSAQFQAGSSLIAKFDGAPVGFLFGFYSYNGPPLPDGWGQPAGGGPPRLRIESQLLGVVPTFRGRNIGGALKAAQAEQARANGVSVIHWTVDPLQYPNARLNFGQLGAVAFTFYRNYYTFRNALNQTPASRLGITWLVDSTRVRHLLQQIGDGTPPTDGAADLGFPGPGWRKIEFGQEPELDDGPPLVAIEIPAYWTTLQKEDPELAGTWRASTDAVFERLLGIRTDRYVITGVGAEKERKYLLAQRSDNALLKSLGEKNDASGATI